MYLIIDTPSMITSAFYGTAPFRDKNESDEDYNARVESVIMKTSTGVFTNAIKVSLQTILGLIVDLKPDHVACVFDVSRSSLLRRQEYQDYKGNRSASPNALRQQLNDMRDVLSGIGIKIFEREGYEADDFAKTLIDSIPENEKVIVVSKDHDYFQLVKDNVTVWMPCVSVEAADALYAKHGYSDEIRATLPKKMFPMTPGAVLKETGVIPSLIPDLKGIVGDNSDNIPGIKGVGEKSAPELLMHYGSLEAVYEALEKDEKAFAETCKNDLGIKRSPVNALKTYKADGVMSKHLATMVTVPDVDCDMTFVPNEDALRFMVDMYELNSLNEYGLLDKFHEYAKTFETEDTPVIVRTEAEALEALMEASLDDDVKDILIKSNLLQRITSMDVKLHPIKKTFVCPTCKQESNRRNYKFCPFCGQAILVSE